MLILYLINFRQLRELSHSVQIANLVKRAYEDLESANELIETKKYLEAAEVLGNIQKILQRKPMKDDDEDAKRSLVVIKKEYLSLKQKSSYVLGKDWDEHVKVTPKFSDTKEEKLESVALEILIDESKLEPLVQAMHLNDILSFRMQRFCQGMMNNIIKPLMNKKAIIESQDKTVIIHFKEDESNTESFTRPLQVIEILEVLLISLINQRFGFPLTKKDENEKVSMKISELIAPNIIEILLKQCLIPSIPSDLSKLEDYENTVLSTVTLFHSTLIELKMILESDSQAKALVNFAKNIRETFINKRCRSILAQARILMKKDLHVTTLVKDKPNLDLQQTEEILKTVTNTQDLKICMDLEEELLPLPQGKILLLELRQYKNDSIQSKIIPTLKLPLFFTTYKVREKTRQFQNWNYFD